MDSTRRQFLLASLTLSSACQTVKHAGGQFAKLLKLQAELIRRFGLTGVELQIVNLRILQINIINSAYPGLSPQERQAKCLDLARFAYEAMEPRSGLTNVVVNLLTRVNFMIGGSQLTHGSINFPVSILFQRNRV